MKTTVYKIECEFDMGFRPFYLTLKEAEDVIMNADWSICDMSLSDIMKQNLVEIIEIGENNV